MITVNRTVQRGQGETNILCLTVVMKYTRSKEGISYRVQMRKVGGHLANAGNMFTTVELG